MKLQPLISVVIPAYNAEQFLDETLESVLSQTYENWECIIVNDGSTDSTESVAKKWCEKDSRFRLTNKENGGFSSARNWGIKESKAEYIAFLDADDLYMPNFLEVCLETLIKKDVDLVAPRMLSFTSVLNTIIKNKCRKDTLYSGKEGVKFFLHKNRITIALLCKKSVLEDLGYFTWHKKAEDFHCWLKMLFAGYKIYKIDEFYAHRRIHNNSLSNTDRSCTKEVFEIIYHFKDEILNIGIDFQNCINLSIRRYILLKDEKGNILPNISERMGYINTVLPNFFPKWIIKLPLGEKVRKLIAIQIIKLQKY